MFAGAAKHNQLGMPTADIAGGEDKCIVPSVFIRVIRDIRGRYFSAAFEAAPLLGLALRRGQSGRAAGRRGCALRRFALDGVGADGDVAAENGAFFDQQLACAQVSFVMGGLLQFDAIAGGEIAVHVALDDDRAGVHVGLKLGLLGHVQPAGRGDRAFEASLQAHRLVEGEFALNEASGPRTVGNSLLPLSAMKCLRHGTVVKIRRRYGCGLCPVGGVLRSTLREIVEQSNAKQERHTSLRVRALLKGRRAGYSCPMPQTDSDTPQPVAACICPHCGLGIEVTEPLADGTALQCPHCEGEFLWSEQPAGPDGDESETSPEAPAADDELDSLRIREARAKRQGIVRNRAYLIIGSVVAVGLIIKLVQAAVDIVHFEHYGWTSGAILDIALAALGAAAVVYMLIVARRLKLELDKPMLDEPQTPPDFSTLGDGSERKAQQARDLERPK